MATKPQRRKPTTGQVRVMAKETANAVTALVMVAVRQERKRNRKHFGLLWLAVVVGTVLGVWL